MTLYYGIILRNHITELYQGIILQNDLHEKDPGDAREVLGAPLGSRGSPGHASGTPGDAPGTPGHAHGSPGTSLRLLGRPWDPRARPLEPPSTSLRPPGDAPGTPETSRDHLCITKTVIYRQTYSARSSRLLCSTLPIRAHRLKDSTGLFSPCKGRQNQKRSPLVPDIALVEVPSLWPHMFLVIYI